jgi:hypothetical protein
VPLLLGCLLFLITLSVFPFLRVYLRITSVVDGSVAVHCLISPSPCSGPGTRRRSAQ